MIQDMRQRLQVPYAHFTTVQLAPYGGGSLLGPFRDMQCATTLSLANTSCTVIDDDGDLYSPIGNVHSRNKQLVGRRVAAGILANVYGTGQQAVGPTYAGATFGVDGTTWTANVTFTPGSLAGGLVYVAPFVSPWQVRRLQPCAPMGRSSPSASVRPFRWRYPPRCCRPRPAELVPLPDRGFSAHRL